MYYAMMIILLTSEVTDTQTAYTMAHHDIIDAPSSPVASWEI